MPPSQHLLAQLHQLCHRVLAIANVLLELRCNECGGLCGVQLQTTSEAFLGEKAGLVKRETRPGDSQMRVTCEI